MLIPNDDALVTRVELERQFKEKMKEQERQAIKALIVAKELLILAKGLDLELSYRGGFGYEKLCFY